ncbi:triose-phosphate isomerase [Candidatus Pacearchaeota archaeon]|nr:triose-phosphate isomerase [Candidatus Pacearchaeota archaeon]
MKPVIIINMKTYNQGSKAINLAKKISEVDSKIIIGVQPTNIFQISKLVKNPIYSEHVDFQETGRNTGYILPEAVKASGAKGVFLNHSEHRLDLETIKKTAKRCKKLKLKVGIFAKDLNQAIELKKLKPEYLMIEPPELVAGKISVSKAKPKLIAEIGKKLKYPFIVGAGIKNSEDLKIAVKLGSCGIAISSAITTAKNPKKVLKGLIS